MKPEVFSHTDRLTPCELARINDVMKSMTAADRLLMAKDIFGLARTVFTISGASNFMTEFATRTYHDAGVFEPLDFVFVDTLLHGPETLDFINDISRLGKKEGYVIHTAKADTTLTKLTLEYPRWRDPESSDFEEVKRILKVEPLNTLLRQAKKRLWISGPRRDEQASRVDMPIFDQREDGLFVLHPIVDWTLGDIMKYNYEHNIQTNFYYDDFLKKLSLNFECGIHLSGG